MTDGLPPLSLAQRLNTAPRPTDMRRARALLGEFLNSCETATAHACGPATALLLGIADHSPYLWQLIRSAPERLARLLSSPPETSLLACLTELRVACGQAPSDAALMHLLRRAKQETALLIALADLGGVWPVVEVTQALSDAADTFVSCALRHALKVAGKNGGLIFANLECAEDECGLVVLALGKHGARELNYSSDTDLVVFFDPGSLSLPPGIEPAPTYVRITKMLARLLQERTADGYVLRVDLRLRPDPGSTAIAISLPSAFHYYETLGQNWERAALIKARPVAGQLALGAQFLNELAPFIWRKYFDFAAIADIHAMKRQIHAVRGHAEVTVAGHDVKLGRGGIREVEFFVQTQQLIFGGRRSHLRGPRTLDMLVALQRDGWVTQAAVDDLSTAYQFLRNIEHRLQMLADEQTQRLPSDPEALKRFAHFCGYPSSIRFASALMKQLKAVEKHYARLFEHAPVLAASVGSLVFTGVQNDPETLATLRKLGFREPAKAAETVRGWHFGRRAAVQSPRAREVLTELVPGLLEAFSGSGDPDAALANFDQALAKMPAAVELFSLLKSNATLRELFGDILGGAPRLADVIVHRPHLLDAAIDPATAESATLQARFARSLATSHSTEDFLDNLRDLAQDEMFAIGVSLLSERLDPSGAALAYSALAEVCVRAALTHTELAFEREYGRIPGGRCALLAMGKLGSQEMTATSDLDLILIYDFDEARPDSDGPRKLHAVIYYSRLTQRLVSALTVATRRGGLYEVDLRLRPSGGKGPLASQLRSFVAYQENEAETWEHMALVRARILAGNEALGAEIAQEIHNVLARQREAGPLKQAVADMRALIAREKGEGPPGDLKLVSGGLLDIEFIAQYLVLEHAGKYPQLIRQGTEDVLACACTLGLLPGGADLIQAHRLYSAVTQMQRLTLQSGVNPAKAAVGVKRRLAAAAGLPDFERLAREIVETRAKVRAIFGSVLGFAPINARKPK